MVVIRAMSLDERAIWEELWTGYLDFYNTKISQETKSVTWARLHTRRQIEKWEIFQARGELSKIQTAKRYDRPGTFASMK